MKVLLVFPPQAQPFLPHLAIPSLTAALKQKGIETYQRDYNLEAYEYYLSPPALEKIGISTFIAHQVEHVKKSLRTGFDYYLPSDYYGALNIIEDYLIYTSRSFPGCSWSLKGFDTTYSTENSGEIIKAARDRKVNPFIPFFKEKMAEIGEMKPDVLGISVAWKSQIIPAFTLACMVKDEFPDIHITMGGSLVSHLSGILKHKRNFLTIIDSFLPFEAEESLPKLVEVLEKGGNPEDVPGLIYRKKKKVFSNPLQIPQSLEDLPFPDFDEFHLKKYYSSQVYLPISASRGCYWAKCAFCTHHLSGSSFRTRKAEDVYAEMNAQYEKYGCKNFYFVDDALPPVLARQLAEMIAGDEKPYRWAGELRSENMMDRDFFDIMFKGGCRLILFGLESFCQRTLDRMNKGWDRELFPDVIKHCSDAGIITWVFLFLGFPGERRFEAKETLRFVLKHRKHIDMIAPGRFVLTRDSAVYKNPSEFGVKEFFPTRDEDLQLSFVYNVSEGLQATEAEDLLHQFRKSSGVQKFLEPFVTEPHLLFFRKSYFENLEKTTPVGSER